MAGFTVEFYQTCKEVTPILKLFQKFKKRESSQTLFGIILISKPGKGTTQKENYTPISLMEPDF